MKALPAVAAALPAHIRPHDFSLSDMRVFTRIPEHHHDVAVLCGMVLVYETDTLCRDGLLDGSLYVLESQHPVGGMSWETYDRLNRERGPGEPRICIKTRRRIVRVVREGGSPRSWWQVWPDGARDGPFEDWAAVRDLVGRVVGVYQPVLGGREQ